MASIKQVVILGGGFGGVNAAQTILKKTNDVEVILIDPKKDFIFTPLIHEVAAGHMPEDLVRTSYAEIFTNSKFKHIQAYATHVNFDQNVVFINDQKVGYDILVLATGATSIKPVGNGTNVHELKTIEDAININNALKELKDEPMNIAVVGGGATGVEMALETRNFLSKFQNVKIYIITRDNDILLKFHPSLHILAKERLKENKIDILTNTEITKIEADLLTLHDRTLKTEMILWTVGVTPHYPFNEGLLEKDDRGRVVVDEYLRSTKYQNVYCVGDIVSAFQMDAQSAVWHGKYAGKNIARQLNNEKLSVGKYKARGELVSLGGTYAIGRIFGLTIKGLPIWFLWRTTYLFKTPTFKKKIELGLNWFLQLLSS